MFPLILKPGTLGDKDTPSGGSPNALFIPLSFSLSLAPEGQPSREGGPEAVSFHANSPEGAFCAGRGPQLAFSCTQSVLLQRTTEWPRETQPDVTQ